MFFGVAQQGGASDLSRPARKAFNGLAGPSFIVGPVLRSKGGDGLTHVHYEDFSLGIFAPFL